MKNIILHIQNVKKTLGRIDIHKITTCHIILKLIRTKIKVHIKNIQRGEKWHIVFKQQQ